MPANATTAQRTAAPASAMSSSVTGAHTSAVTTPVSFADPGRTVAGGRESSRRSAAASARAFSVVMVRTLRRRPVRELSLGTGAATGPVMRRSTRVGSELASDGEPPCGELEPPEPWPPDEVGIDSQYWFKALSEGPPKQDVPAEARAVQTPRTRMSDKRASPTVRSLAVDRVNQT